MSLSPPSKKQKFGMTTESERMMMVNRHLKERQKKLSKQHKHKRIVKMNPTNRQLWMNIGDAADSERIGHKQMDSAYSNKMSSGGTRSLSWSHLLQTATASPRDQNLDDCLQHTSSTSRLAPSPWTNQIAQILNSESASAVENELSIESENKNTGFGWFLHTDSLLNPLIPILPRIKKH